ncbi:flagellar biosynthetic protein FliO [Halioxenophilus sp. WMMB6]|uniref:flagellar biosynthetic protein FliO n=1 Tax=Halioxenophilus sp. WMMB6 TaxID=3073815 RepID=UPI00295F11A4|nr:flagellar biosynthetic protein FliO [Halioxenophilus sp. WMMB6]
MKEIIALCLKARDRCSLGLVGLLASQVATAQSTLPDVSGGQYAVKMVLGLAVTLGLIFALAWLLKRVNGLAGFSQQKLIRVTSQTAIGMKEKLVIVEVANRHLLLGLTPNNISLLHTFAEGELEQASQVEANSDTKLPKADGPLTFQQIFSKFSDRGRQ